MTTPPVHQLREPHSRRYDTFPYIHAPMTVATRTNHPSPKGGGLRILEGPAKARKRGSGNLTIPSGGPFGSASIVTNSSRFFVQRRP